MFVYISSSEESS